MKVHTTEDENSRQTLAFLEGKSNNVITLFYHFISEFQKVGSVTLQPAKTMVGVANSRKRIAYITQFGKNFIHVVFPFKQPYNDNLCFQKIAQVPDDSKQFNHHFRMCSVEDLNEEVVCYMRKAYEGE